MAALRSTRVSLADAGRRRFLSSLASASGLTIERPPWASPDTPRSSPAVGVTISTCPLEQESRSRVFRAKLKHVQSGFPLEGTRGCTRPFLARPYSMPAGVPSLNSQNKAQSIKSVAHRIRCLGATDTCPSPPRAAGAFGGCGMQHNAPSASALRVAFMTTSLPAFRPYRYGGDPQSRPLASPQQVPMPDTRSFLRR